MAVRQACPAEQGKGKTSNSEATEGTDRTEKSQIKGKSTHRVSAESPEECRNLWGGCGRRAVGLDCTANGAQAG